jgi:hypothetical protein
MSAEARIHPRFSLNVLADVIGDEIVLARPVADVSLGGCRFGGEAWENPGTQVQVVLSFPTLDAHLPVLGVVVRSSDRDMGVRFHDLNDEQKWALRKYMRQAQRETAA